MEVKLALTAEEWKFEIGKRYFEITLANPKIAHKTAAMNLYEQPFGFTREDVKVLRDLADHNHMLGYDDRRRVMGNVFEDLASRIEALLPPEEDE